MKFSPRPVRLEAYLLMPNQVQLEAYTLVNAYRIF